MAAAEIQGPMRGTVEDFDSIVACLHECFPTERDAGGMDARWPHCLQRTPERMRHYLVMKDGARVVGCLGYADQTVAVDGDELRVAGLGGVSTLPEYRGGGLMSRLLDEVLRCMAAEGFALSELGGDRLRYGRYGWEVAGREWQFNLTTRSAAAPPPSGWQVRRYEGEPKDLETIMRIHDAEPRRVKRSREQYGRLLGRLGKEVWLAENGRAAVSYAIAQPQRTPPALYEFGGDLGGLHAILASIVASLSPQPLLVWSPCEHPATALFFELASYWQLGPARMLRLFDLAATLRGFRNQLAARFRQRELRGPAAVSLAVAETGEQVTLAVSRDGVEIAPGAGGIALVLPRRAMVRLLFGPAAPSVTMPLPSEAAFLDALLPLDFTIWHNETV